MCRPNVEFAVTCESVTAQCVRQLASALWKADYSQYNSLSLGAESDFIQITKAGPQLGDLSKRNGLKLLLCHVLLAWKKLPVPDVV